MVNSYRSAIRPDGLGFDLDGLAGLRIATHAGFAMGFNRTSQVWNYELTCPALALLHRQLEELFKKCIDRFPGRLAFLRQMAYDFGFAQWLCHLDVSPPVAIVSSLCGGPNQGRARATL